MCLLVPGERKKETHLAHCEYEQIRCVNMAYTYVHVLQIHCCHLESCKSGCDICLRNGSQVCRKIVVTFLTDLLTWEAEQVWLGTTWALCSVSQAVWVWLNERVTLLLSVLFKAVWQQLGTPVGSRYGQNPGCYFDASLPNPYLLWLSFFTSAVSFPLNSSKAEILFL